MTRSLKSTTVSELETASKAAIAAGQMLCEGLAKPHQENFKAAYNIVTEMDLGAEHLLSEMLSQGFPDYGFLGEESNQSSELSKDAVWIVDPLDGTTNYSRGYPLFAVSIALKKGDKVTLGVVYNPLRDELFAAEEGCGATLNARPIRVTQTAELGNALLATGFPYDASMKQARNCEEIERFIRRTLSLRCDGSASLDLCHVAAGRLDGYWETGLDPWDMAAGALIVKEAGGLISLKSGAPFTPYQGNVLASNGHLHAKMLEVLTNPSM
ncbi:MAG: inositol monophosphatase family protein [Anaerolineales bacterium]